MMNKLKKATANLGLLGLLATAGAGYAQEATEARMPVAEAPAPMPTVYLPQGRPSELFIGNSYWAERAHITLKPQCENGKPLVAEVAPKGSTRIVPPFYWQGCPSNAHDGKAITIEADISEPWLHLSSRNPIFSPADTVSFCDKAYLSSPGSYLIAFGMSQERTVINLFAQEETGVYFTAYDALGNEVGQGMHTVPKGYSELPLETLVQYKSPLGANGLIEVSTSAPIYVGSTRYSPFQQPLFEKGKPIREPGPGIGGCTGN